MPRRIPLDEVLARQARKPEVAEVFERNAVADAVSIWLVRYRTEHGLSQSELAARCGFTQPAIARLEAGDVEPRLSTLLRLADALGEPLEIHLATSPTGPRVALASRRA